MTDVGDDEYIRYRGSKEGPRYIDDHGKRKLFADAAFNISGIPDTFDWRDYGELLNEGPVGVKWELEVVCFWLEMGFFALEM